MGFFFNPQNAIRKPQFPTSRGPISRCGPLVASLARPYAGKRLADALGLLTLIYPPLLALGFDEFHELGLLTPLVLVLVLAADRRP